MYETVTDAQRVKIKDQQSRAKNEGVFGMTADELRELLDAADEVDTDADEVDTDALAAGKAAGREMARRKALRAVKASERKAARERVARMAS